MLELEALIGPVAVSEPVQGFVGNETYRVRTVAGETYYVKSGPGLGAEARACSLAAEAGVPAPEIVAVGTNGAVEYLIQRAVAGGEVGPGDTAVLTSVGVELVKLHRIAGDGFGLLSGALRPTWAELLMDQVGSLDGLVDAGLLPADQRGRLVEVVADLTPEPDRPVLLHGDLHPRHIYAAGGVLTGIIDWGDALYGDPLFDLARFSIAGAGATYAVLDGYGLELTAELERTFALFRAVWSAVALRAELDAGGDWFQPHLDRIAGELARLS
ncbi:phosphotransferase family protein [Kribbella sp. CA-253562]|uniref:phosphotransferase family protein n=1 Tax=Kribbella sp. CA-253562 TaxID=3239942 RepID=UPI003D9004A6